MSKNQPDQGNEPNAPKGFNLFNILIVLFLITFLINIVFSSFFGNRQNEIEYSQFIALTEGNYVEQVIISEEEIEITLRKDANESALEAILFPDGKPEEFGNRQLELAELSYKTGVMDDPELITRLNEHEVSFTKTIVNSSPFLSIIAAWIIPLVILYLFYYFIMRRAMRNAGGAGGAGGMFGIGKSKAKEYSVEKNTGITFADVAGQDEAKESLMEMVDFLHQPERYHAIGAKQPKGALLVGPPGTGKTLLAKAVAGEAKVPFYSLSGSEFVEMFVGVGASRVRDLFEQAKKNAPCIIFIDEIDAIGKSRNQQLGSNDEREQTLNQLLAEMDGFDSSEKSVVILAATNRPEVLDQALLRPGRFDRRIIVEKPDLPGREAILKVHAAKVKLADDVNLRDIALATPGATGADLANMINEGALGAVKAGRDRIQQEDLMEAVEVVIAGKEKKDRVMNPKEKRMVAYHEVGHALVSALQKNAKPVQKITIVPRTMGSLGYTMNVPEEERYLMTKEEILAEIRTLLGGRAAELIEFNEATTGASNDIERATKLARGMVTQYGMSDQFGSMSLESNQHQYLDGRNVATCSEQTNASVDEEVRKILANCQQEAIDLVDREKQALEPISDVLLEKENLDGDEFMSILEANRTEL